MLFSNYNSFFSPQQAQAQAMDRAAAHQARGQTHAAANQALGSAAAARLQQPANFANAYANAYQSYAGGLGGLANAMANERSNLYGANAMAEAARMGALSNLGSSGLGAYGSASNAAMNALAQNQMSYNAALANMYNSDTRAQAVSGVLGALGDGGVGGTFSASGTSGPIASGSYASPLGGLSGGGSGGGGGGAPSGSGLDRLDSRYESFRNMPADMLGQSLSGLLTLTARNADQIRGGMDQFYGNQQYAGDQSMSRMDAMRGDMGGGFGTVGTQLGTLWDDSLGKHFLTPAESAQQLAAARTLRHATPRRMRPVFTVRR